MQIFGFRKHVKQPRALWAANDCAVCHLWRILFINFGRVPLWLSLIEYYWDWHGWKINFMLFRTRQGVGDQAVALSNNGSCGHNKNSIKSFCGNAGRFASTSNKQWIIHAANCAHVANFRQILILPWCIHKFLKLFIFSKFWMFACVMMFDSYYCVRHSQKLLVPSRS